MLPLPSNVKVSCFVCITNSTCSIFFAIKKLSEKQVLPLNYVLLQKTSLSYIFFENKQKGNCITCVYYAELHISKPQTKKHTKYSKKKNNIKIVLYSRT